MPDDGIPVEVAADEANDEDVKTGVLALLPMIDDVAAAAAEAAVVEMAAIGVCKGGACDASTEDSLLPLASAALFAPPTLPLLLFAAAFSPRIFASKEFVAASVARCCC